MNPPKYSLPEIERRWLVEPARLPELTHLPCRHIEDCYIEQSLLRLRRIEAPDGEVAYKLCKKYGRGDALANPITNLYLSPEEYLALRALPGLRVHKQRYAVEGGAIDIYPSSPALAIFEIEFDNEHAAADYTPPHFAGREITHDSTYSGAALAGRFAAHARDHTRGP
jgi:CYTH domain-containing protein